MKMAQISNLPPERNPARHTRSLDDLEVINPDPSASKLSLDLLSSSTDPTESESGQCRRKCTHDRGGHGIQWHLRVSVLTHEQKNGGD
jgi:hypothetical protein